MRERPIPCRGATLAESRLGTHKTWADDGYCDRCRVLNAQTIARLRAKSSQEGRVWVPQVPSSASPPAGSPVAVPEVCMASRGDGIFDDGFLSRPSPGEQSHSGGASPCLPEPVPAGTAHRLLAGSGDSPAPMSGMCRPGHTH